MVNSMPSPPLSNEEALKLCKEPDLATKDFMYQHTMYRIKDPKKSLPFYTGVLGMRLLHKVDFPNMKFSIYFLGYEQPECFQGELSDMTRKAWAMSQKANIELTQYNNWGTENDPNFKHHNGNLEPRGYGHIGIMVPDVKKACDRFEALGVNFIKRPQDGVMKTIAHITDPDGYWFEIFNNKY